MQAFLGFLEQKEGTYLCGRYTRPSKLTAHICTRQNTHKFHHCNQYSRPKKHSANRGVTIRSEDREIIASSSRSNERRQAPGPSVNSKEETNTNRDLRNESQKTSTFALTSYGGQASGLPAGASCEGWNASNFGLIT